MKTILVTGAAGFIGYHLCNKLLKNGYKVIGVDNVNNYYDVNLKYARLNKLGINKVKAQIFGNITTSDIHLDKMQFIRLNIEDREGLPKLFKSYSIDVVCNLAAQAGVRYSIENPEVYIDSNINGFLNILECCRNYKIKRLVYASSSSVYGNSDLVPFKESDNVDFPISLYAATKKSNELMAFTYSHLYGLETIGLRFFTVYGPWGRPDMAMFLFTDAILNNKPVKVFNNGNLSRDFTYIDDIIDGVKKTILHDSKENKLYNLYNIGNNSPINLLNYIEEIEKITKVNARKSFLPMQQGDVMKTWADTSLLNKNYGYVSKVNITEGVKNFIDWYLSYYNI